MVDGMIFLLTLLLAETGEFPSVEEVFLCLETDGIEDFIFTLPLALNDFILSVLVWDSEAWEHSYVWGEYFVKGALSFAQIGFWTSSFFKHVVPRLKCVETRTRTWQNS